MIIILFSWIVLLYMISIPGIILKEQLNLSDNKAFILLYGVIFQTFFASLFAFFYKIDATFFIINLLLIVISSFYVKNKILPFFSSFLANFNLKFKIIFLFFVVATALKSAQLPSIFDNETYYIQTIKWLNEYGYVKGLANVHPFLAQCSFWHVLQSANNFSFLNNNLNDINGFILIVGFYYFIEKYRLQSNPFIIVNSLFLIFYYQFIDSPSPDLPILVITSVIFYEFIFTELQTENKKALLLFIIFLIFIKLTVIPLLLLAFYILCKEIKATYFFFITSFIFGSVWIIKNSIITGYPLFPLSIIDLNLDWKLPAESVNYMYKNINNLGYASNASIHSSYSIFQKLTYWIQLNGINRIFNLGTILLIVITPFTPFYRKNSKLKLVYVILIIHFIFLLLNSPQYRFFLPTFIFLSSLIIHQILSNKQLITNFVILFFSSVLLILSVVYDVKSISNHSKFQFSQLIKPEPISKYKNVKFEEIQMGNLKFYSPNLPNLYETTNGKLPCVNKKLLDFYSFYPQQRTSDINDGFYSKKMNDE
jgi:hypothetical protein